MSLMLWVASDEEVGPVGQCEGKPLEVLLKLALERWGEGVVGVFEGDGDEEFNIHSAEG